jgi:hypothetical protein
LRSTLLGNGLLDEHIKACRQRPPRKVLVQTGQRIDALLDEGIDPDEIRAGLHLMRSKNKGPGLLDVLVQEARCAPSSASQKNGHQPYRNPVDQSVYSTRMA